MQEKAGQLNVLPTQMVISQKRFLKEIKTGKMKIFIEEQKFNQPLVIIIHSIAFIGVGITTYNNWPLNSTASFSQKLGAFSGLIFIALIAILFLFMKLKTRVDVIGIHNQFYPFHFRYKTIRWAAIDKCYLRKYNAISEYGGWGNKFSLFGKNGKSFTTKGNIGLQLKLKNGKNILIGTQKKEELQRTLDNYKDKITSK